MRATAAPEFLNFSVHVFLSNLLHFFPINFGLQKASMRGDPEQTIINYDPSTDINKQIYVLFSFSCARKYFSTYKRSLDKY